MSVYSQLIREAEKALEKIELTVANDFLADFSERVFEDGLDSKGQKIGTYSERPFKLKPEELKGYAGLLPVGRLKNTYFKGGYKEFREKLGREGDFVNLDLTGSLRLSVKVGQKNGKIAVGIIGKSEVKKARDNEQHFGKDIFSPSKKELENIEKLAQRELKRRLK